MASNTLDTVRSGTDRGRSIGAARDQIEVTFTPVNSAERLLPDWRGLAAAPLDDNPFMLPEFLIPAASQLQRGGDMLLVCAWRRHARSRELIGLMATTARRAGLLSVRYQPWTSPWMPTTPLLLAGDEANATAATAAFLRALADAGSHRVQLRHLTTGGMTDHVLASAAQQIGASATRSAEPPRTHGMDIALPPPGDAAGLRVTREPAGVCAMIEEALIADARAPRQLGDARPLIDAPAAVLFLRAVARGFLPLDRIVTASIGAPGGEAVAIALTARDRSYLWRIMGRGADEPGLEAALVSGIGRTTGLPVAAAADRLLTGFCTSPWRTSTLDLRLR